MIGVAFSNKILPPLPQTKFANKTSFITVGMTVDDVRVVAIVIVIEANAGLWNCCGHVLEV